MPLVRIDVLEGRPEEELRKLADVVQEVMEDVFVAPERDRYQIIHEHRPGRIIAEDTGLGFRRTEGLVTSSRLPNRDAPRIRKKPSTLGLPTGSGSGSALRRPT